MNRSSIIVIVVVLLAGLTSCSIEKRHYRDGFYIDWKRSPSHQPETVALEQPAGKVAVPIQIPLPQDSTPLPVSEDKREVVAEIRKSQTPQVVNREQVQQETAPIPQMNPEKSAPAPIEKDKKQAVGAGIAAAIFFILGMLGLIIKGTAPPTGIFIGAAFACFLLCVILASFLYPRETKPKETTTPEQPKSGSVSSKEFTTVLFIFLAILVALLAGFWGLLWILMGGIF